MVGDGAGFAITPAEASFAQDSLRPIQVTGIRNALVLIFQPIDVSDVRQGQDRPQRSSANDSLDPHTRIETQPEAPSPHGRRSPALPRSPRRTAAPLGRRGPPGSNLLSAFPRRHRLSGPP